MLELIRSDLNIDFLGKRKIVGIAAIIFVLISIATLAAKGLNLGIDFTGGTLVEVRMSEPKSIADVRASLEPAGYGAATIQQFGSPNDILIRLQNQTEKNSATISGEVISALKGSFGESKIEMRRVEFVGPQVGKELTMAGIWAVLFALGAILIYITFRFEFRFAVGADVATLHDVIVTLGIFALLGHEFTLTVVAAVLTVLGYSLNDTIVVFDRIRESMANNRKRKNPLPEWQVANEAINQTLSRTTMTSFVTLLSVLALFFWGGEVIHDFALVMIIGIVVGTFSSIYIASPTMLLFAAKVSTPEEDALKAKRIKELEARP